MIITLIGADFSKSNIGTLSSWIISRALGDGATYSGPSYVDKDAALSATVTLDEGYEIGSAGITITMDGTALDESCYSVVDNVITFTIASVTGNVMIKVPTLKTTTGISNYIFTINPTPTNATVTLSATGCSNVSGTGSQSIIVANGTEVNWRVEASGYTTRTGNWTISGDNKTENIVLLIATPTSLDDIAYEKMSYREIFITNNRAPDINNNSMTNAFGNISYADSTGTTSIVTDETAAANYVPPYSLKVSGTSSQQAKGSWIANEMTAYLLAANIKVTDYTKGYCGMIYGTEFQACADRITDGYEVFVGITPERSASQLFIGSASSANLTGYINNPVAVRTSLFTTVPTAETFTELYKNYTALLIAGNK